MNAFNKTVRYSNQFIIHTQGYTWIFGWLGKLCNQKPYKKRRKKEKRGRRKGSENGGSDTWGGKMRFEKG